MKNSTADYIQLTPHSAKITLIAIALLFLGVLGWAFFGSVTDRENIKGVVFPSEGTIGVNIPSEGTVKELFVHKGDKVTAGQSLALVSVGGSYSVLSAPDNGTVLSYIAENHNFNAFQDVVNLLREGQEGSVRSVTAYADFTSKRFIKPGQQAQVTPSNETRERVGYVRGTVKSVAQYPASREDAVIKLQNASLAQEIFPDASSVFEIEIELRESPEYAGELDWSFPADDPIDMSVGTFCNIEVVTKSRSIIQYLFENVKEARNSIRQ